jgi:hypothetical protein
MFFGSLLGLFRQPKLLRWPSESFQIWRRRVFCPPKGCDGTITVVAWKTGENTWTPRAVIDCSLQRPGLVSCEMSCLAQIQTAAPQDSKSLPKSP